MNKTNKSLAFIFPGQGSQSLGMLSTYASEVRSVFQEASLALGKDLWALSQQGPESEINHTVNTQPLLLAAGVALWRVWQQHLGDSPALLAGHSLGEYTALVCANAISLSDAIQLVAKRGKFMQEAVPEGKGAMAAVLGLADDLLQRACEEAAQGEVVACVNFNAIGQTVIAGDKAAVDRAGVLAKEKGAKKVVMLPVSVPSHCKLMEPAAKALAQVLVDVKIVPPTLPVIHNVDVKPCKHPDDIREHLVQQLISPVRWVETVQYFATENIKILIECGPGKVLTGLTKRIDPTLQAFSLDTKEDLTKTLTSLNA
ncbi:MAG: ACP S-malonyltransferase [Candidatus Berkiellales bacterium]